MPKVTCSLCDAPVDGRSLRSPQKLENRIIDLIKADRPEWEGKRGICPTCLEQYRAKKFVGYLEAEYRKLSEIERSSDCSGESCWSGWCLTPGWSRGTPLIHTPSFS